jgi:hypothetical protein
MFVINDGSLICKFGTSHEGFGVGFEIVTGIIRRKFIFSLLYAFVFLILLGLFGLV